MTSPIHLSGRRSNYDKAPFIEAGSPSDLLSGLDAIIGEIRSTGARRIALEAYPGVAHKDLLALAEGLGTTAVFDVSRSMKPELEIDRMVERFVTDDPVFGYMTNLRLANFFDGAKLEGLRRDIEAVDSSVVYGTGATLASPDALVIYFDMPRWEGQLRQRRNEAVNLGTSNFDLKASLQYKRSFFVDWRVCDRHKLGTWDRIAYFVDTTTPGEAKMIKAASMARSLEAASARPFRVVPYFDPAPWGGEWIRQVCDLDADAQNYGWCFDCVPEENSLLLGFGTQRFEIPSVNLVFTRPEELLGEAVFGRFGAEFPIRFDFLDTMGGGNLSFQVHPPTSYIQQQFGMNYTQDESYYLLDAGDDASVYLGLKEGIEPAEMIADLRSATDSHPFPVRKYVNRFPAKSHDHFLIPAGTVHCSGANSMVLEISATPYIFTFKMWDWGRLGLDGTPRPIHLDHGAASIRWDRNTSYAKKHLINQISLIAEGDGWKEERTGLHPAEFIETRRHWFSTKVDHQATGGVGVLNLVQGDEAVVESPDGAFDPFAVHFAETFIVPAAAGPYTVRPAEDGDVMATIKAFVRT